MALAKQCDLCGKFYKPYNLYSASDTKVNAMYLASRSDDDSRYYTNARYDLCPECMLALKEFIESRGGVCKLDI